MDDTQPHRSRINEDPRRICDRGDLSLGEAGAVPVHPTSEPQRSGLRANSFVVGPND